jgi:hypothetical protein
VTMGLDHDLGLGGALALAFTLAFTSKQ